MILVERMSYSVAPKLRALDRPESGEKHKGATWRCSECTTVVDGRVSDKGGLGRGIDEFSLLRGKPSKYILSGNIVVGFKDELYAHHEVLCGVYRLD